MKPEAPIVAIGTFWHLDDLFGRIIDSDRVGTEEFDHQNPGRKLGS
jgi:hypothetical protein